MTDKAIEARREYKRKWNREHADRVKTYQKNYWEKKAAANLANKQPAEDPEQ